MTENPQDRPAEGGQQPDPGQPPYSGQPPPPPPPPPYQAYGQQSAPVSPSDARMWSMFAHLGGIFFSFIPALVIYLMYKDRDPFIRRHATQALNFQIVLAIAYLVSYVLMLVIIGFLTYAAAWVACLVFSIIAAMAANRGEEYTYPMIPQMVT